MWLLYSCWFFFFKQKTAYEMRISDWSSDVCSSDLGDIAPDRGPRAADRGARRYRPPLCEPQRRGGDRRPARHLCATRPARRDGVGAGRSDWGAGGGPAGRSEEHTSEIQSLMRISYAVFCLKKKKHNETKSQQIK